MPVNHAALLRQGDWDQTAIARAARAGARVRTVQSTMCGTNEKLSSYIEKSVGLEIHFHGHMATTVQVSMRDPLETDGKGPTRLTTINHIKRNRQTPIAQVI